MPEDRRVRKCFLVISVAEDLPPLHEERSLSFLPDRSGVLKTPETIGMSSHWLAD